MIKNLRMTYRFPIICFAMLFLFAAIGTILNGIFFTNMLLYTFYQIFCMIIPGYAVIHLLHFPAKNQIFTFGFSLAIGYAISILTYIVLIPLSFLTESWMIGIAVLNYVIAAVSLAYLIFEIYRKRYDIYEESDLDKKEFSFFLLIWLGVFLLYFFFYGIPNTLPGGDSEQVYYIDTLYWIGNALSLSRGFPPESVRGIGQILSYHYFSSIHLVAIEKTVGIPIQTLGLVFSYIQSSAMISFGFYSLFTKFFNEKWKIAISFPLLLFSLGINPQSMTYYTSYILTNPFGFDYALGIFSFALIMLRMMDEKEISFLRGALLYLILMPICLGTKAPIAVILLLIEGLICLKWLITKEKWYKVISFGIISLLIFFAVYITFMSASSSWMDASSSNQNSGGGFELSWEGTSTFVPMLKLWYQLSVPGILKPFLGIGLFVGFMFLTNLAIMFLVAWRIVFMIRYFKKSNIFQWVLLAAVLVGISITLFVSMVGFSQIYFTVAALPVAIILGMYHPNGMPHHKKITLRIKWSVAVVLTAFSVSMAASLCLPLTKNALVAMNTGKVSFDSIDPVYVRAMDSNVITPDEYEGYKWIEANTPKDSILITNATVHSSNPLITNVFTNRRMLIESNVNASVSRPEADRRYGNVWGYMYHNSHAAYLYMCEVGVNYAIILTKFKTGTEYTQNLECVYSNAGIEIYKLQ